MARRARAAFRATLGGLGRFLLALGLLFVFGLAVLIGVLLHLDLPAGRRLVAVTLTTLLSRTFKGELSIGRIDRANLRGVVAADFVVTDRYGQVVLRANRVRARANLPALLHELLLGGRRLDLAVRNVRIERVDVYVLPDRETGIPTIAEAFTPEPGPPEPKARDASARPLRVWLPTVEIGRIWSRVVIAGGPTLEANLQHARGSVLVTPDGAAIDVERFGMLVRGLGGADAVGTGSFQLRAAESGTRLWSAFDGHFGDVQTQARFRLEPERLTLTVEAPRVVPEQARALWQDWPLQQPASVYVEASGQPPNFDVTARVQIDGVAGAPPGQVSAQGRLSLSPELLLSLDASGRDADLRALWPELPQTALELESQLEIWNRDGQLVIDVNGLSRPTRIADQDVPAVDVTGTYTPARGLIATATLHEPRVPLKVDLELHPGGALDAKVRARGVRLEQSPRLRRYVEARGLVDLDVDAHIENQRVTAKAQADVRDFRSGELELASGRIDATISGPLARPDRLAVRARITGKRGRLGELGFDSVAARAEGPVTRPKLNAELASAAGPSIQASGTLTTGDRPRIDALEAAVVEGDTRVEASLGRLEIGPDRVLLEEVRLRGSSGNLDGSIDIRDDLLAIDLRGEQVDVARLCKLLGLPRGMFAGTLDVDARIRARGGEQSGRLRASLRDGSVYSVSGLSAEIDAELDQDNLTGKLSGELASIAEFESAWDTRIGPVSRVESWRDVLGMLRFQLKNVDLAPLGLLLPASAGIQEVSGRGFAHVRVERRIPEALPTVFLVAGTERLRLARSPETEDDQPQVVQGIDLQLGGDLSGETGALNAVARLVDEHGVLLTGSAQAQVALDRLVHEPERRARTLAETPLTAVISLPDRPIAQLPRAIQPALFEGVIGGRVAASGRADELVFTGDAHVRGLKAASSRYALPVDLTARVQYDTQSGEFGASSEAKRQNERLAVLVLRGTHELAPGADGKPRWRGGGQLSLSGLPLPIFAPLAESQIDGKLYGSVGIQRSEQVPTIAANVQVQNLTVDALPIGEGRLLVRTAGSNLSADVHFEHRTGKLDATTALGLGWSGLVPELDEKVPIRIALDAESYDAAILRPMVSDVFSELGGTLHAELQATLYTQADPEFPELRDWTGELAGDLVLQDGTIALSALGLDLEQVTLSASARKVGNRTRISVAQLDARARSDEINLRARAELDLAGFRLQRASATASMRDVPLLIQGVPQASATGQATMALERKPGQISVALALEDVVAKLPRSTGRSLVELGDNPNIEVLQPLREPTAPTDAAGRVLPWRIELDLSDDVRVVRNDLEVPIGGKPVILLADETRMAGEILLEPGGRVQLMGKSFVIESGRIRFVNDDPANPSLVVTASWQAPQHVVFVEVRGTAKAPVISFRSDPPLPQPEVVALLLGGGGETGAALAVGRGVGASIFNELFSDTPLGTVEIRTAETETGVGKYTAAIQVSDKVWVEANYYEPQKEHSNAPDANQQPIGVTGTVDWRFHRNWSLRTELGAIGAGADLLWQYRY